MKKSKAGKVDREWHLGVGAGRSLRRRYLHLNAVSEVLGITRVFHTEAGASAVTLRACLHSQETVARVERLVGHSAPMMSWEALRGSQQVVAELDLHFKSLSL